MGVIDHSDEYARIWVAVIAQTLTEASTDFSKQFKGNSAGAKAKRLEMAELKRRARLHMQRDGFDQDCAMIGLDADWVFSEFCKMEAAA